MERHEMVGGFMRLRRSGKRESAFGAGAREGLRCVILGILVVGWMVRGICEARLYKVTGNMNGTSLMNCGEGFEIFLIQRRIILLIERCIEVTCFDRLT